MSEKATDVILEDRGGKDKVLDGVLDELMLVEDGRLDAIIIRQL
jgi:hypothetical protein